MTRQISSTPVEGFVDDDLEAGFLLPVAVDERLQRQCRCARPAAVITALRIFMCREINRQPRRIELRCSFRGCR